MTARRWCLLGSLGCFVFAILILLGPPYLVGAGIAFIACGVATEIING